MPSNEFTNPIDSRVPHGPIEAAWKQREAEAEAIDFDRSARNIVVVGAGLAGLAATAALAERGYSVELVFPQSSPLHTPAASRYSRLLSANGAVFDRDAIGRFHEWLLGRSAGDAGARPANVYRLAELSAAAVALWNRLGVRMHHEGTAGAIAHSAPIPAGQNPAERTPAGRRLVDAFAMQVYRHVAAERVKLHARRQSIDFLVLEGECRGVVARNLTNGMSEIYYGDAVVLASGGYGAIFDDNGFGLEEMGGSIAQAYRRGAWLANPSSSHHRSGSGHPAIASLGGLWVDYDLMSNVPGLFAPGAANGVTFGTGRQAGADGLEEIVEGWFVTPASIDRRLHNAPPIDPKKMAKHPQSRVIVSETAEELYEMKNLRGPTTPREFHARLRALMLKQAQGEPGMSSAERLAQIRAMQETIRKKEMAVTGTVGDMNRSFEYALAITLAMQLAEPIELDRAAREREPGQKYISIWEYKGLSTEPAAMRESLEQ